MVAKDERYLGYDEDGFHSPYSNRAESRIIADEIKQAIAARDKEWVEWGDKYIYKLCGTANTVADCGDCTEDITQTCIYYQWQERKKEIGL